MAAAGRRPATSVRRKSGEVPPAGISRTPGKHYAKATLNWYRAETSLRAITSSKPDLITRRSGRSTERRVRGPAGDYQLVFNNGAPTQIDLFNSPVTPETDVSYLGVHVNDTWTIARRLTLNLGARYKRNNPVIPAQCRLASSWSFSPASCIDKVQFNKWNSVAPRLYFSYDVTGRAKTVIKGGWGRFDAQRIYDLLGHANPIRSLHINLPLARPEWRQRLRSR